MKDYIRKPLFGREGAGVTVFKNWIVDQGSESLSETESVVYQALAPLAEADGNTAVVGSWLIDGEPGGIGIRESSGLVTTNTSRFVPHLSR